MWPRLTSSHYVAEDGLELASTRMILFMGSIRVYWNDMEYIAK